MRVFLCEKPSQGKDIARVLGARQRGSGCYRGAGIIVTWGIGHLVEAAPPEAYGEQYKRWSIEQLPIVPERWRVEIKPSTAAQFEIVRKLIREATELVIGTDADREGEMMIAREILELCGYRGPVRRLWLSALRIFRRPMSGAAQRAQGAQTPPVVIQDALALIDTLLRPPPSDGEAPLRRHGAPQARATFLRPRARPARLSAVAGREGDGLPNRVRSDP